MKFYSMIILSVFIVACSNKPWCVIDGNKSQAIDPRNYDVYISGVDGKLYFDNIRSKTLEPGFHLLRLTTTKADRKGYYTYSAFPIFTKPCIRYYVSAQHKNDLEYDNKDWDVRVLKEEPIKSCLKLMNNNKPGKQEGLPDISSGQTHD